MQRSTSYRKPMLNRLELQRLKGQAISNHGLNNKTGPKAIPEKPYNVNNILDVLEWDLVDVQALASIMKATNIS
jgi:hypothetical protein